ncbi:GNAT family N-acetyltransferase [Bacillus timonensis]|nr:GNAT family N-acetyltransferase [Bacillus timonensis]
MSEIRKLSLEELSELARINTNAYPGAINFSEDVQERYLKQLTSVQENDPNTNYYGIFRDEKLVGGMRFHHFMMNVFQQVMPVGGIGSVAVDLLHKKEKIAKELLEYFIQHYKSEGIPLVMLYPFRPDFYKRMGFGYGTKMHQYKMTPSSLPKGTLKDKIVYLNRSMKELVKDCFNRYAEETHGMVFKTDLDVENLFKNPNHLSVGVMNENKLEGYVVFAFQKVKEDHFILNDIHIKEIIYETPESLSQLLTFLHSQSDQFRRIVWNTQDDHLHFILSDPTNGSNHLLPSVYHESHVSGVGLMYRIIDVKQFFNQLKDYSFGNVDCRIKLSITDSFLPENEEPIVLHVESGYVSICTHQEYDVELKMDISDFSSLVLGATNAKSLYQLGLLEVSNCEYINLVNELFFVKQKPICMTAF